MLTGEERDRVRERLLALAEADPVVVGAAITGSYVEGASDEWSDVDLVFCDRRGGGAGARVVDEAALRRARGAPPLGPAVGRDGLPGVSAGKWARGRHRVHAAADFGPRGPKWRTVFGETVELRPTPPQDRDELVGLAWHHVLHARACIERSKPWEAEWLIGGIREYVLALACLRLGYETRYGRGADLLPPELTAPLEATLVRSVDETELRRALTVAVAALTAELEQTDATLASQLRPVLLEVTEH